MDGAVRREVDYLVTVTVTVTDNDRLRDIVAKAVRMRLTERLRLEPVEPSHTDDLARPHDDDTVAFWYAGRWSTDEARRNAPRPAWAQRGRRTVCPSGCVRPVWWWACRSGLAGRSGWPVPDGRRRRGDASNRGTLGDRGHAWVRPRLELGLGDPSSALGRGLATELGRAGLAYAFDTVGSGEVVAFTERHNTRSRAVMERLGMTYVGRLPAGGVCVEPAGAQQDVAHDHVVDGGDVGQWSDRGLLPVAPRRAGERPRPRRMPRRGRTHLPLIIVALRL
ncbi:GNAT family N-acetyltransferase [Actinopolymorpha sp. B11F2]|uniref:GNAT family N-acetyltransferase n=1 Tax=Actinopolymorpha sp. B11F2 TaxID=3160862 RepID=UPI0032E3AE44